MIPEIDGSQKVLGPITVADLSHVGVHGVVAPLGWLVTVLGILAHMGPDGWLFAAVISALWVEGVDILRVGRIRFKEARDLFWRLMGAGLGWAVAALLNLII